MFGISMPEMFLILAIAIIVIGPKKLPDLAKTIGRAIGELKKAAGDFKESMDIDDEINDVKNTVDKISSSIGDVLDVGSDADGLYHNNTDEKQTGKLSKNKINTKNQSNDIKK